MPLRATSQIAAARLKSSISLNSIFTDIQSNKTIELAENSEPGNRPVPVGASSPFMIIDKAPYEYDIASFYEAPEAAEKVEAICQAFGLTKKDLYLTYALKYPANKGQEEDPAIFKEGRSHISQFFMKELLVVNPEIIFLVGNWVQRLFLRVFKITLQPSLQKVTLEFMIDEEVLEYDVYVYPINSLETFPDQGSVKQLIERLKIDWQFVHLHCHNSLSLKDGVGTPETRINWHLEHKKPAIATTNHGNISDWIKIYEGARNNKMVPILGVEAYVNRYAEQLQESLVDDSNENKQKRKELKKFNRHLTLLAKNGTGFYNLIRIHNDAWLNRFYRNPICSPEIIKQNKEGIICLSGCSSGEQNRIISDKIYLQSEERKKEIAQLIDNKVKSMVTLFNTKNDERASEDEYLEDFDMKYFYQHQEDKKLKKDDYREYVEKIILEMDNEKIQSADAKVRDIIDWWHSVFGNDFYIELMVIDFSPQKFINEELIKIAQEKNIPIVITNDCHYLTKADAKIQELQMLSDQDKTFYDLEEDKRKGENKIWTIKSEELYYKTVDELYEAWQMWHKSDIFTEEKFWQAVRNTIAVVEKVQLYDLDRSVKLPKLYGAEGKKVLAQKVLEGMKKYGLIGLREYQDRVKFELNVIIEKEFVDYFLVLEDLISWIKKEYGDLAIGAGRGSAAGGLVNYCLGLTYVDPIKHKLLFERFLDPSREDLPDIDQDVQPRIRDAVIEYMRSKYGEDSVATIGTFSMLKFRSAILDAARVCGIPVQETLSATTKLPMGLDEKKSIEELEQEFPHLKEYFDKWEEPGRPLRYFINSIRGTQRQPGTHAAGVLISSNNLKENIPLIRSKKTIVTGWIDGEDGRELSSLNYSKMDVLGLKNLEVIEDAIKFIEERQGKKIDISQIDINDKFVFDNVINAGDNFGVFQFESNLASGLIKKIHPDSFDELADINAIMRPGPLDMGTAEHYANRKHGIADDTGHVWTTDDIPNCIKDILADTYGLLIYQEQIMLIAEKIGGHTKKETNKLRKLLIKYGKTSQNDPVYIKNIKQYHDKFIEHAARPEHLRNELEAENLWELMASFASYGFNRSHSVSYTLTSYREYWLKAYYPAEFNVALINNTDVKKEKKGESVMAQYITEITRKGFNVLPPSINNSDVNFTLNKKGEILWGLGAIKNLPEKAIEKIMEERQKNPFADLEDLTNRISGRFLNKRAIDALVWSGALDEFIDEQMFKARVDIYNHIYVNIRHDKKFTPIASSKKFIIDKETEYCKLSLTESKLFNSLRIKWESKNNIDLNPLYEVEELGNAYKGIGKVVKLENKITKTKKPYIRISLQDETHILKNVYCWPWKLSEDDLEALKTGVLIYAELSNESGFINLERYVSMGSKII